MCVRFLFRPSSCSILNRAQCVSICILVAIYVSIDMYANFSICTYVMCPCVWWGNVKSISFRWCRCTMNTWNIGTENWIRWKRSTMISISIDSLQISFGSEFEGWHDMLTTKNQKFKTSMWERMRMGASLKAFNFSVVSKMLPRIVFGICQKRLENVFLSCRIFYFIFLSAL